MPLQVVPYTEEHVPLVAAFHARMRDGGANPAFLPPLQAPGPPSGSVYFRRFLILDGEVMRGAYLLQYQPVWLNRELREVTNLQGPISEGIVNKKYVVVAAWMFKHLAAAHPLLFAVGMGGMAQPLPRFLKSLGWRVREVPFLFRVANARRFVGQIEPLRTHPVLGKLARLATATRTAGLLRFAQWRPGARILRATLVTEWTEWADAIWLAARENCSFSAVRDSSTLAGLYPADSRTLCFRLEDSAWVALQVTKMKDNPYFGDLCVGTVVDGLAVPGQERQAVDTAIRLLHDRGAEVILTNQLHPDWVNAFRAAGFWPGPSNYLFAESPPLARALTGSAHLTRGDGDGRYHL